MDSHSNWLHAGVEGRTNSTAKAERLGPDELAAFANPVGYVLITRARSFDALRHG
ncbi:MAG TPA: hypothetical protein VJX16_14300 [Terriglobales bacterium]|nr:hypothetical protein [Terriglobales bacterium]